MSKLSFRARALDASKPLPIYHARDVPDISDYQAINRTVPQMPTGMEKEEETERHLQEVILAQQTNCQHNVFIPTPQVETDVTHYHQVYQELPHCPSPYIRVPGLGLEEEVPDYDLDSEDEEWLSAQTKERPLSPLHFERMMDKLERGSGNTVLSVRDAQSLLRDEEDLVIAVYDYWLAKRLRLGRALIPAVKNERRDGTSSNNPYLAFRKRMEKMQTRKNRKNDETAYMQMLKLKRDLLKAKNLAEFVLERENKKHELAKVEADILRRRYQLEDWSGSIMASLKPVSTHSDASSAVNRSSSHVGDGWEPKGFVKVETEDHVQMVGRQPVLLSAGLKRKSKKKKFYFPPGTPEPELAIPTTPEKAVKEVLQPTTTEKTDEEDLDGIFTFKRRPHVRYHKVLGEDETGWDMCHGVPLSKRSSWKRYWYNKTAFAGCYIGRARRRIGRGGRVLWDRDCGGSESEREEEETEDSLAHSGSREPRELDSLDLSLKRCRYISRSPSPTSNFEFQSFPLIESTDPLGPPTDPVTSMAIFEFGGFTSDSELPEDASSFLTLPTSQFALKPSTSDVECENSTSQEEHMDISESPQDQDGGHQTGQSNPQIGLPTKAMSDHHLRNTIVLEKSKNSDVKMFTLKPPPTEHVRRQPQTPQSQNFPPEPLQNLPPTTKNPVVIPPSHSTTATPTATPAATSSTLSLSSLPSKLVSVSVPDRPGMSPAVATPTSAGSPLTSTQSGGVCTRGSGVPSSQQARISSGLVDPRMRSRSTHEQPATTGEGVGEAQPKSSLSLVTTGSPSNGGVVTKELVPGSKSDSDSTKSLAPNGLTNPQSLKATDSTGSTNSPSPSLTSWMMDGPSSSILLLNSCSKTSKPLKSSFSSSSGEGESVVSMAKAASAITSQFQQQQQTATGGGGGDEGSGRGAEQIQPVRSMPIGLAREIPLPLVQGTVPMTSSRLPTSLTPSPITPKLEGAPQVFDKRATVSGQGLMTRRASATANGSAYPEILQHTARRFSETTERGLKQALAGINHNSLLETAANSLVQPRGKPSEVS